MVARLVGAGGEIVGGRRLVVDPLNRRHHRFVAVHVVGERRVRVLEAKALLEMGRQRMITHCGVIER